MGATDNRTKEITLERVLVLETEVGNDCRLVLADSLAAHVKLIRIRGQERVPTRTSGVF